MPPPPPTVTVQYKASAKEMFAEWLGDVYTKRSQLIYKTSANAMFAEWLGDISTKRSQLIYKTSAKAMFAEWLGDVSTKRSQLIYKTSAKAMFAEWLRDVSTKRSQLIRVGHRVLLRSERYILLHSKKRMLRSFPFFSRVFGDLWNPKERYVLFSSFEKNGKEWKERNVLL